MEDFVRVAVVLQDGTEAILTVMLATRTQLFSSTLRDGLFWRDASPEVLRHEIAKSYQSPAVRYRVLKPAAAENARGKTREAIFDPRFVWENVGEQ